MLGRFAGGQRKTLNDLQTALTAGDRDTARRHAHSIAGAAGNLGAEALGERGKALETALKDDVQDVFGLLEDLLTEAVRAIEGIEGSSEVPGAPPSRPTSEAAAPKLEA
jgi:HPt (histidine-containing phosphotransfer) domain-containing protein